MGYNSRWEGALTPSRPIPGELVYVINGMGLDCRVVNGCGVDNDSDGDVGDIVPSCREMPGSSFSEDVCRVQRLLDSKKTGIRLSGVILRTGEDSGDFEKIEVVKGRVYSRGGEVRYGPRTEVTLDRWAVRVTRQFRRWPGKWKTCGWVVMNGCPSTTGVMWSLSDTPPSTAARFEREDDAFVAAHNHADKTHRCEVVKTEALR